MKARQQTAQDIHEYIARFPAEIREILENVRTTIQRAAPEADETIKYGMPTFVFEGNLVHFAAFKEHIALFPPVKGDAALQRALTPYAGPKGNLRFPLDEPIPYRLIARVVKRRVQENAARAKARRKK